VMALSTPQVMEIRGTPGGRNIRSTPSSRKAIRSGQSR
jgi:hypothetical protein